jgi:hypothetical protein
VTEELSIYSRRAGVEGTTSQTDFGPSSSAKLATELK